MSEALTKAHAGTSLIIGAAMEGGYFAGVINVAGTHYGLAVSPKAGDLDPMPWGETGPDIGATSCCDGMANTLAMADAGSELAQAIRKLNLDGYDDWYLPARDEQEMLYRQFKPLAHSNAATFRDGDNPSSVPGGYPYTAETPPQTTVEVFQADGPEAFEPRFYWASTQYSANFAWDQDFANGTQGIDPKGVALRARAVRRFLIN
ncbi:MAG: DUF1566 domain-containing protein [Oceanospirillaceae bacterium]|nr:DUF1566 domain-containing protein [Oceanospirillaceae bacterium]